MELTGNLLTPSHPFEIWPRDRVCPARSHGGRPPHSRAVDGRDVRLLFPFASRTGSLIRHAGSHHLLAAGI